ncbi:YrrS family protein [Lentibacillus sp. Marseille-P4043]|uniref:YrrS family protein n=1 Tax=Lentibacillus sp. Marseille-P4043 TaxID=2040293 RepID=UPI000D0B652A|nr:YrrS family protein [Lentibacillus sp. Marseille-P4043]
MNDYNNYSRVNKFEKRRKNTKQLSILLVVGGILIVILICILLFGGGDDEQSSQPVDHDTNQHEENATESGDDTKSDGSQDTDDEMTMDEENPSNEQENDTESNTNVETEQIETPDDANVTEAYTGDWQPIGTKQQGTHTTNYDEGSQDRIEIEQAIRLATGLEEGNMTTWWLERDEDQGIIATVSDHGETQTYRTYLTWVENEGWQPTKVEVLKENDQKYRFE